MAEDLVVERADIAEGVPCVTYLATHPGEALNKTSTSNMGIKVHVLISRCELCLSSCYHVSMQQAFSQFSVHTDETRNQNAT